MGHAHTAPYQHGEAIELLSFKVGYKANILCIYVNAVVAWEGNTHLEFAREIGRAINRLSFLFERYCVQLFTVNPNFVIGMAAWSKAHSDTMSYFFHLSLRTIGGGRGAGHYIAVHVAAGRQGGKECLVNGMDS